jgi:hypothetical protein
VGESVTVASVRGETAACGEGRYVTSAVSVPTSCANLPRPSVGVTYSTARFVPSPGLKAGERIKLDRCHARQGFGDFPRKGRLCGAVRFGELDLQLVALAFEIRHLLCQRLVPGAEFVVDGGEGLIAARGAGSQEQRQQKQGSAHGAVYDRGFHPGQMKSPPLWRAFVKSVIREGPSTRPYSSISFSSSHLLRSQSLAMRSTVCRWRRRRCW